MQKNDICRELTRSIYIITCSIFSIFPFRDLYTTYKLSCFYLPVFFLLETRASPPFGVLWEILYFRERKIVKKHGKRHTENRPAERLDNRQIIEPRHRAAEFVRELSLPAESRDFRALPERGRRGDHRPDAAHGDPR